MNLDLLKKLVKLANNNPNENEANSAARRVCKMIEKGNFQFVENSNIGTYEQIYRSTNPFWRQGDPFEDLLRWQKEQKEKSEKKYKCRECEKEFTKPRFESPIRFGPAGICNECQKKYEKKWYEQQEFTDHGRNKYVICPKCKTKYNVDNYHTCFR